MAQPRRPAEGGDPARPLADLERCFRICFLMIPAMVPAGLERSSQPPPPLTAVSSRSRLTGTEERRPSAHSRERLEALAEATAAAAAAESPEHDAQAAAAAASAILAAASPKRPGAGRRAWGRSELEVGGACGSNGGGRGRGGPAACPSDPASILRCPASAASADSYSTGAFIISSPPPNRAFDSITDFLVHVFISSELNFSAVDAAFWTFWAYYLRFFC